MVRIRTFAIFIVAVCALLTASRIDRLADVEPRFDQAFFAWWVYELAETTHVLPVGEPTLGWVERLEGDTHSTAHQLLRNFYNKPVAIFTSLPLLIGWLDAEIRGFSYDRQVALGIVAAGLLPVLIGLFPIWRPAYRRATHAGLEERWLMATGAAACGLTALLPALDLISPLGVHNFGMAGLLAGAVTCVRHLDGRTHAPSRTDWLVVLLGHVVAFYCHWTNLLLLPPAVAVVIWATDRPWTEKIRSSAVYAVVLLLAVSPIIPFAARELIRPEAGAAMSFSVVASLVLDQSAADFVGNIGYRAILWFDTGFEFLSVAGLFLGLSGLILLAFRERMILPLAIVAVHIAVFSLLSGFAGARLRTFPYILPFLALGMAYAVAAAATIVNARRPISWIPTAAAGGAVAAHLILTAPAFAHPENAAERLPALRDFYYTEPTTLRLQMAELVEAVPEKAILFTWDAASFFSLPVLNAPNGRLPLLPSPISGQLERAQAGTLQRYLAIRRQSMLPDAPMYLAAYLGEPAALSAQDLRDGIARVLGPAGYAMVGKVDLIHVRTWPSHIAEFSNLALYRVELR